MTRVAVFIDYENSRFGAREVFGDPRRDPYTFGHVELQKLALMLKQLGEKVDPTRELTAVYVASRCVGRCDATGSQSGTPGLCSTALRPHARAHRTRRRRQRPAPRVSQVP